MGTDLRIARNRRWMVLHVSVVLAAIQLVLATGSSAQTAFGVDSDGGDDLYRLELSTGVGTLVGATGFNDIEGFAFAPGSGVLYGVDDSTDALVTCDTGTGACTLVGSLGLTVADPGLGFAGDGTLYMVDEGDPSGELYTIDTTTGAATLVGPLGGSIEGQSIAFGPTTAGCASGAFGLNPNVDPPELFCVDLATGSATLIGSFGAGVGPGDFQAMDFDQSGILWAVDETDLQVVTVDPGTGIATDAGYGLSGFLSGSGPDSLAVQDGFFADGPGSPEVEPIPVLSWPTLLGLMLALGLVGALVLRRSLH
jgi:hypothetical protein